MELPFQIVVAVVVSIIIIVVIVFLALFAKESGSQSIGWIWNIECYVKSLLGQNCRIEAGQCVCR